MIDKDNQFYEEYKEYGLDNIPVRNENFGDERKGITITANFDIAAQKPLDSRTVVRTRQELEYMDKDLIYMGLLVYVIEDNKLYQWKRVLQEDKSEKIEWGPIEAEVSAVEFNDEFKDEEITDYSIIPPLMMQKNKDNFYPVTYEDYVFCKNGQTLLEAYQKKDLSADENGEKLETEMQTIVGAINELNSKMDETIEEFTERINKTIEDLNQSVKDMQDKTNADMAKMKADLQKEIDIMLAELNRKSEEMDQTFKDKIQEINDEIAALQQKIQDDIDQMLQDVDNSILSDGQVNNLLERINNNIAAIDGNGVMAASFETYECVVVVDSVVTEVSFARIGTTVNASDKLFVHINSVYLVENVDYSIDYTAQKIICLNGEWNSYNITGCEFAFDLIKKIITIE